MQLFAATSNAIDVLIADSNRMQSQLLTSALRRRPEFQIAACQMNPGVILQAVATRSPKVTLLSFSASANLAALTFDLRSALYTLGTISLEQPAPNQAPPRKRRRWTIIAAGLLLLALAVVVLYTSRAAFSSPLALVVVAAIGFAALLLQLRFRQDAGSSVHTPLWLNFAALVFAVATLFADILHFSAPILLAAALGAVVCFALSGVVVLRALRR